MSDVSATLAERGQRYGSFDRTARIVWAIKRAITDSPNWLTLSAEQQHAMDMIGVKLARILNGAPNQVDSWHDIAGYAKLVEDQLTAPRPAGNEEGAEAAYQRALSAFGEECGTAKGLDA